MLTGHYQVWQFRDGVPLVIQICVDRTHATLTAYALAGIPFIEHSHHGQSIVRSARGMWAVLPAGDEGAP